MSAPAQTAPPPQADPTLLRRRTRRGWSRLARPYALTGGRTTSPDHPLLIEALVEMTWHGYAARPGQRFEQAEILDLVTAPMSIAEVAAHMEVPLGVVRVLVGDLLADGLVLVHPSPTSGAAAPPPEVLDSILEGLRAL